MAVDERLADSLRTGAPIRPPCGGACCCEPHRTHRAIHRGRPQTSQRDQCDALGWECVRAVNRLDLFMTSLSGLWCPGGIVGHVDRVPIEQVGHVLSVQAQIPHASRTPWAGDTCVCSDGDVPRSTAGDPAPAGYECRGRGARVESLTVDWADGHSIGKGRHPLPQH
jgi:hypothetical protein